METTRRSLLLLPALLMTPGSGIELWMGGDVHLGEAGPLSLQPIARWLTGGLGIVNLEGPVGAGVPLANARALVGSLRDSGIRIAGIANNHQGDLGPQGPTETAAALRDARVMPAGGPAGPASVAGIVVTAHDLAGGIPHGLGDELRAARARGDVLVATFHVTGPPSYLPRPELRAAVELALAEGARVVAAHGTHALGPVERRGDAVIAWGLGNLSFACDCTDDIDGAVLRVALDRDVRAWIFPIEAGLRGAAPRAARDPALIFDLLEALGSTPLSREGVRASF